MIITEIRNGYCLMTCLEKKDERKLKLLSFQYSFEQSLEDYIRDQKSLLNFWTPLRLL